MKKNWLQQYPADVPAPMSPDPAGTLLAALEHSVQQHRALPACRFMGRSLSFGLVDSLAQALAGYLQALGLGRGERVALMLPNVPQALVAVLAVLRAGCVVVNVNPLLGPRELAQQLGDSGARAIVVIDSAAAALQEALQLAQQRRHPVQLPQVVLARLGDLAGALRGRLLNHWTRHVHKTVPAYELPQAVPFNEALASGRRHGFVPVSVGPQDIALLQYTGGEAGVDKGAVLLQHHLLARWQQTQAWQRPALAALPRGEQVLTVVALPTQPSAGLAMILLQGLASGGCSLLVHNLRDITPLLRDLMQVRVHAFAAAGPLYQALASHPDFDRVDWRHLCLCVGGGLPAAPATAALWLRQTACVLTDVYGVAETGPAAISTPLADGAGSGAFGLPLPHTAVAVHDAAGARLAAGVAGEIAIRGPQVMAGYWQRPDETAKVMTADGFFRSGDIGVMDERGLVRVVKRRHDSHRLELQPWAGMATAVAVAAESSGLLVTRF